MDAGVAEPPTRDHDGHGVFDHDEADQTGKAEEGDDQNDRETDERAEDIADVAGVVDGLGDARGFFGGDFGGGTVDGGVAEGAVLHGGVDGLVAVGAGEDVDFGGEAQGHGGWLRWFRRRVAVVAGWGKAILSLRLGLRSDLPPQRSKNARRGPRASGRKEAPCRRGVVAGSETPPFPTYMRTYTRTSKTEQVAFGE